MGGKLRHGREELVAGCGPVRLQQRCFQRGGAENLEVAPSHLRVGILAGDHLALFRDADRSLNGAAGLSEDRLVARAAAAPHRPAAAMEQAQPDVTAPEHLDQRDLRLVELPPGCEVTAVLVAVGVAQHHLLRTAAALQQALVFRQLEQLVHHPAAVAQIGNGLEQRNDVDVELAFAWPQQAGFLEQQRHFQNIRDAVGLGDDVVGHRFLAVLQLHFCGGAQDRQLGRRLGGIRQKRTGERPRRLQLIEQQADACVLGQRCVPGTRARHLEQLAQSALVHVGVLAQIDGGEMKTEDVDGAPQAAQPAARQRLGSIARKRAMQDIEVGLQFVDGFISRRLAHGAARGLESVECPGRGCEPCIDAGDRAAIGLVLAVRRPVGRALRQLPQFLRRSHQIGVERKLAAQQV